MIVMRTLKNVYNCIIKLRSLEGDEINTRLSISERLLLGELNEWGMLPGGIALSV